jgi:sec-independent protein translocase protein TatA
MFPSLGFPEMVVIMIVAVLLFGKRLPEVGKSLGKGLVEFKKGMRGLETEFESASYTPPERTEPYRPAESSDQAVPKFELPGAAASAAPAADSSQPYQD